VVWAINAVRPYVEGFNFHVRTDHEALRWLLTLTDSSGRLLRWRLRLAGVDYTVTYRPGRVHQVPDALSRLETEFDDGKVVDDDVPTFGDRDVVLVTTRSRTARVRRRTHAVTTAPSAPNARPVSPPLPLTPTGTPGVHDVSAPESSAGPTPSTTAAPAPPATEPVTMEDTGILHGDNDDEALDDVMDEELDLFDVINVYEDDGTNPREADV